MNEKFLKEVGERIRDRRIEIGMTQEELALKSGFKGKAGISLVERGERNITTERLTAIANALKVTPQALMGWEIEPATVSAEEKKILETVTKLYNLPKEKQDIILKLIDSMVE